MAVSDNAKKAHRLLHIAQITYPLPQIKYKIAAIKKSTPNITSLNRVADITYHLVQLIASILKHIS